MATKTYKGADYRVMQAFLRGERITNVVAIKSFGCFRFHALLSEQRKAGWVFYSEWEKGVNRDGRAVKWKWYKLVTSKAT